MGKKRSVSVSRVAELLIERHPNGFTSDFEENKRLVSELMELPYKAARNKIAGHITHLTSHGTLGLVKPMYGGGEEE